MFHSQKVMASADPRSAINSHSIGVDYPQAGVPIPELAFGQKSPGRVEVADKRGIDRSRDVTGSGVNGLCVPAVTLTCSGV